MADRHVSEKTPGLVEDRFFCKVAWGDNRHGGTRCLEWIGSKNELGYGGFRVDKKTLAKSHRWLYERWVGLIPDGMDIDHLCRNPACVNPDHLEPVTHAENVRRGRPYRTYQTKTHCPQGHPYEGDNLYVKPNGARACRECNRVRLRKRREMARG